MAGSFLRSKITFDSQGSVCRGYLYLPVAPDKEKYPCVIMANGFSGTADWILPSFGEAFSSNGIAALLFDYRHLGESDGMPRQLIDPGEQFTDLERAVEFARSHSRIDGGAIVLWGTSLGGSYVFKMAVMDSGIAAVIGNMPALDAVKGANFDAKMKKAGVTKLQAIKATLQLVAAAAVDSVRGLLRMAPFYVAVYGRPGESFFSDPSMAKAFDTLQRSSAAWQNRVAARFLFRAPRYREGTFEAIKVPVLLTLAQHDVEISNAFIKEKAKKAQHAEINEYPFGHFDLYHGDALRSVLADQVAFLKRVLKV
jgi:hypothetical protein